MNILQIVVAVVLVGLLVLLLDPFMVLMPPPVVMLCLVLAAALVAAFGGFVLAERAQDERELMHRLQSGRTAYLAGLAILTLGFLVQGFVEHHIDPWIAAAIAAMIVTKLLARSWSEAHN